MIAMGSFFIPFSSEMPWALTVQTNRGRTDAPVYFISNLVNMLTPSYYRPQRSCGKVMFPQASVILFTGGGAYMAGGVCGRRPCVAGGMHGRGHMWWGACMAGWHVGQGMCGRRDGHCSRRYASYWNEFLLRAYLHVTSRVALKYPSKVNFV